MIKKNQALKDVIMRAFTWPPEDLASLVKQRDSCQHFDSSQRSGHGRDNFGFGAVLPMRI